jgi:hypothetical protein
MCADRIHSLAFMPGIVCEPIGHSAALKEGSTALEDHVPNPLLGDVDIALSDEKGIAPDGTSVEEVTDTVHVGDGAGAVK